MNRVGFPLLLLLLLIPFAKPMANDANDDPRSRPLGAVTLPIAGTAVDAAGQRGVLNGTVTINRFVEQNNELMAIGVVRGAITNLAGQVLKSGLEDVVLPVTNIGQRTVSLAMPPSAERRLIPVSFTEGAGGRLILAQAQTCGILHLDIGGNNVDLLGFTVHLSPITLDVSGNAAGPLGSLSCQIVKLLGTAGNVVGLLNTLLGALTGLAGGLTAVR
jgi:hypothetical protein